MTLLYFLLFSGSLLRGTVGFGSAVLVTAIGLHFYGVIELLLFVATTDVIGNLILIGINRKTIRKNFAEIACLAPWIVAGIVFGFVWNYYFGIDLSIAAPIVIVISSIAGIYDAANNRKHKDSEPEGQFALATKLYSILSGLSVTLSGLPGPFLSLAVNRPGRRELMVGTLAQGLLVLAAFRLWMLIMTYGPESAPDYSILLVVALIVVGTSIGHTARSVMSSQQLSISAYSVCLASAGSSLYFLYG